MKKSEKEEKGRLTVLVLLLPAAESCPHDLKCSYEREEPGREGEEREGRSLSGKLKWPSVKNPHIFPVTVPFFYYLTCFRKRGKGFCVGKRKIEFYLSQLH